MAAITGGTTSGADGTCRSITGTASTRPASATAAPAWRPAPNGSPGPKRIGTPISRRNKSRGAGTGKIQTRLLTNAQKGGMLFYIYRNAMTGKSNGSFLSESRRVVRGGRAHGVNLHPASFSAWAALSPIKRRQRDFFLCRKTSGTADSVRLIKRWDGLFSSNCKEEHPE